GRKELRNPSAAFDTWWYQGAYLPLAGDTVDPLLHHVLVGRKLGLDPAPAPRRPGPGACWPGAGARRICLFAGYDPDGLVDDYVVRFVRELSRHADVYYLADCAMAPGELDRLAPYTKGAWAERHGTYDFGSWSRLARELVGWDTVAAYDELLLVNDSCYLVRPLDEVFAKMEATACDWWGLQATQRTWTGADGASPPTVESVVEGLADAGPSASHLDSLHVSSYFLAYRGPVVRDDGFRRLLDGVRAEQDKSRIILRYEIGASRYLLGVGHRLATFIEH